MKNKKLTPGQLRRLTEFRNGGSSGDPGFNDDSSESDKPGCEIPDECKKVKTKKNYKKNCLYFYPFFGKKQICVFKNQPHIEDKCTGVNCSHYKDDSEGIGFVGGGTMSSGDSFRRMGANRNHDSNE